MLVFAHYFVAIGVKPQLDDGNLPIIIGKCYEHSSCFWCSSCLDELIFKVTYGTTNHIFVQHNIIILCNSSTSWIINHCHVHSLYFSYLVLLSFGGMNLQMNMLMNGQACISSDFPCPMLV